MRRTTIAGVLLMASVAQADLRTAGFEALAVIDARAGRADGLFAERLATTGRPPGGPSTVWAAGVQLSALNAAARLDPAWVKRANDYAVALDQYRGKTKAGLVAYQPFPGVNGGDLYYDDNAWLAMGFVETFRLTGDREHLRRAVDAYRFLMSGETDELGGGIFWRDDEHTSKNTCSNAPAICAALELYHMTGEAGYLADARRLYVWVNAKLQDNDGLYFDAIKLDGSIGETKWSYNTALMIRANRMLFDVTQEPAYETEWRRLMDVAAARWFRATDGALTDEASFAHLLIEQFVGLDEAEATRRSQAVARAMDHLVTLSQDGVYPKRWDGWRENERRTELLTQASAARALLVVAYDRQRVADRKE